MFYVIIYIVIFLIITKHLFNFKDEYYESNSNHSINVCDLAKIYTPNIISYILDSILTNNKDINIYHITNDNYDKNKINIVISGEPWKIQNKVDLSIGPITEQPNAKYHIFYPQMYSSLFEHKKSIDPKDYIFNKTKFCAYMYRAQHEHRKKYFNLISKYKVVDALGECCKNTPIAITRDINNETETYNDIAVELYKDYKFVIAVENTYVDGYFTEKIINPLIANSIPIYWGDKKVFDYINKKRVIYIPDYTDDELLQKIKQLDENDSEYNKIVNESIYTGNDKLPENIEKNLKNDIKEKMKLLLG